MSNSCTSSLLPHAVRETLRPPTLGSTRVHSPPSRRQTAAALRGTLYEPRTSTLAKYIQTPRRATSCYTHSAGAPHRSYGRTQSLRLFRPPGIESGIKVRLLAESHWEKTREGCVKQPGPRSTGRHPPLSHERIIHQKFGKEATSRTDFFVLAAGGPDPHRLQRTHPHANTPRQPTFVQSGTTPRTFRKQGAGNVPARCYNQSKSRVPPSTNTHPWRLAGNDTSRASPHCWFFAPGDRPTSPFPPTRIAE